MNPTQYSEKTEIQRAINAHNSVEKYQTLLNIPLKTSPIILQRPSYEILHNTGASHQTENKILFDFGEHNLLMSLLSVGWNPEDKYHRIPFFQRPGRPPLHTDALKVAKLRGYSVPDEFLRNREVSYSEAEAYYAAWMMVSCNWTELWQDRSYFQKFRDTIYRKIILFTGQFLVPDPLYPDKTPYVIDQLWVVRCSQNQVRLIGIEIDGEAHLEQQKRIRDRIRDVSLAAMGYEIYRVAGWWCRIDSFRVMCELLRASHILPDAINNLKGASFNTIDDYKCGICRNPMVRWDQDWLQIANYNNSLVVAHKSCVESLYDF